MSIRQNENLVSIGRVVAGCLVAAAAVALAIGVLLLALENRRLRESSDCRFDISAEVNTIGDRIDRATALGLVALAEENEPELDRQVKIIREEAARLEPAIERRNRAVEVCQ